MSRGDRLIDFQSSPPSNSSGRPAFLAPWKLASNSAFSRSNWSPLKCPPVDYTSAPEGLAELSKSALFQRDAALCRSIAVAAASIGDSP